MPSKPLKTSKSIETQRRAYRRPQLTDLGDVRELTQALISLKGALDGMTISGMDLKTGGL